MASLAAHRLSLTLSAGCAVLVVACLAMVASAAMPTETLLIFWLSAGGLIGFVFYALKGDLMIAVCAWLFTLMTLHEEFWRMPVPLFFAVTIPRLAIGVLALLLVAMLVLGRFRIRAAWPITGWLLAVIAYFFVSALVTGFQTRSVVSIHYRLIGGYFFPFLVFILILHAVQREVHVRRVALYFAALSVYLGFTGWCEQFGLDALIWPSFIRNPEVGIHWGRVRGPFVLSPAMGLALTYCFFSNLVLARNVRQGRWMLYLLDAGMIPPIFWTKTRSVWLAFVLCCMIWAVYSRRRTMRVVSVSVLLAALLAIAVLNMENFLTPERAKGGLTDTDPILLRIGLAQMTWEIVQAHPWFGLGFGHFRDFAPGFVNDPSSPFYAFGSTALEHNNLLSIAAETGVIGVGLYIAMMVALFRSSIRLYRRLPPSASGFFSRDAVVLYWILAAAYFIDGTFRETSDNPFANSLFFGLSAIPVALGILLRREPVRDRLMVGGPA